MKPTKKSKPLDRFLEKNFGRTTMIQHGQCVWCKRYIKDFRDEVSMQEYRISGLCQDCQDKVFGKTN